MIARARRSWNRGGRPTAAPYLFLLPTTAYFAIFWILPFIFTIWVSLTNWNILGNLSQARFQGLENYAALLTTDPIFRIAVKNTFFYVVVNVPVVMALALGLALLLNRPLPGRTLFRTIAFVPYGASVVALAIIWKIIYSPTPNGLLNSLLAYAGLPIQSWLNSSSLALPSIMIMDMWKWTGYSMVVFLVALSNIPQMYYDAARVDGANSRGTFRYITIPALRPVFLFSVVTSTIGAFQVFAQVYVMTSGGPANASEVVVHYMYMVAFKWLRMGDAAAMAMVLLGLILVLVMGEVRILGERE